MATSASASSSLGTINIRDTPTVVEWPVPAVDGQPRTHVATASHLAISSNSSPITFSLFFDPSANIAFFKIRATILLRDSSQKKVPTYIYLFIYPENIVSLVHDQSSKLPQDVAKASKKLSGCDTSCLRFTLEKTASLIAPLHLPLAPMFRNDDQVLDSWKILANQTTVSVHLSRQAFPTSDLIASACDAAARRALKSSFNHGNLSQLYGGQGGKVITNVPDCPVSPITRSNEITSTVETLAKSPPSYDELCPSSPRASQSSKRRRTSPEKCDEDRVEPMSVLALCKKAMVDQVTQMRHELHNEMRIEIKAHIEKLEARLTERFEGRLDEQLARLREDVSMEIESAVEPIESLREHVDDLIEDEAIGLKVYLEEFVKDEMVDIENTVMGHLEDGRISLQFDR